tara:strand:+ start:1240 stop:1884 length:645 start_codon:yes stop_codon:yes gene_type:complete
MLDDDLKEPLSELVEQWNIAERRIKKAEQVKGNEIVASAIFELRYAGRKIIDTIHLSLSEEKTEEDKEKIFAFIADATEDCVKSKHDAIDAMLDFITLWLHNTEKEIGLGKLQELFPEYLDVTSKIFDVQEKISASRQDRVAGRDIIYNGIEDNDYDAILALYDKIRRSRDRVYEIVASDERAKKKDKITQRVSMGLGALGLIVGLFSLYISFR